jgi:hypothetical protein
MSRTDESTNFKEKLVESVEATDGLLILLENYSKMLNKRDKSDFNIDKLVRAKEDIVRTTENLGFWNPEKEDTK